MSEPNDRIFVNTSYMHDSAEVAWAAASEGIYSRGDRSSYDGDMLVHLDGRATIKWWDGESPDETPFVLVIDPARRNGSYVSVYESEDQPPSDDETPVWKSLGERRTA